MEELNVGPVSWRHHEFKDKFTCAPSYLICFKSKYYKNTTSAIMLKMCVCVPSEEDRLQNITHIICGLAITILLISPMTQLLVPNKASGVITLILGGELVQERYLQPWGKLTKLLVADGPAECTVISAMHLILQAPSSSQNIGKGVGSVCWVVHPDNHDRVTSVGAMGELLQNELILAHLRDISTTQR